LNFQSDISSAEWQVGIAIGMMIVLADRSWLTFGADFSLDLENSPVDGLPTGVVVGGYRACHPPFEQFGRDVGGKPFFVCDVVHTKQPIIAWRRNEGSPKPP
jgi:hypothetical protein